MYLFSICLTVNCLAFPEIYHDIEAMKKCIIPIKPLFTVDLENVFYKTKNFKDFYKAYLNNFYRIYRFKGAKKILFSYFLQQFPLGTRLASIFNDCFYLANKMEAKFIDTLKKRGSFENTYQKYKECCMMRENFNIILDVILNQINFVNPFRNINLNPVFLFAIAEFKSFIDEISIIKKKNKNSYFLLCYKIKGTILNSRISFYLSNLDYDNYFFEDLTIYSFIFKAILKDLNEYVTKTFLHLEKTRLNPFTCIFKCMEYRFITKLNRRLYLAQNSEIFFDLYLIDGIVVYHELVGFLDYILLISKKNEEIRLNIAKKGFVMNWNFFLKKYFERITLICKKINIEIPLNQ